MNLDGLEDRHVEDDPLLRAANAWCSQPDRPAIRHLVELARRAARVSHRAFAAHLVQAPALLVAIIAEIFYEASSVEVRATRAVIVNQPVIRELRATKLVQSRQLAHDHEFKHYAEQVVRIGGTSGNVHDRLIFDDLVDADRPGGVRSA